MPDSSKGRQRKSSLPRWRSTQTLNHLTQASGGGGVLRQDDRPLNIRLKPNEVYAVRALDRPDYYRTSDDQKNQMNGQFQMLISNPVYGTTPPGIDEVSQEQVFKQMREMNAQMIQGKDFDAFPHQGVTPTRRIRGHTTSINRSEAIFDANNHGET